MKTTKEVIAVMEAYERGEDIEFRNANTDKEWNACTKPIWNWEWFDYRIKPKLKPVDLSVLINSGIDCYGWNADCTERFFGELTDIDYDDVFPYFLEDAENSYEFYAALIKPRMHYWLSFNNFYSPDRTTSELIGAGFNVVEGNNSFMIDGLQPDRCWPWEVSDERNEKRWLQEKQELKDEIDVLIMKIALLENAL